MSEQFNLDRVIAYLATIKQSRERISAIEMNWIGIDYVSIQLSIGENHAATRVPSSVLYNHANTRRLIQFIVNDLRMRIPRTHGTVELRVVVAMAKDTEKTQ